MTISDLYRFDNCSDEELAMLCDYDVPGADTALSVRLAARRLVQLKAEEKAKRAQKQAEGLTAASKANKGIFS